MIFKKVISSFFLCYLCFSFYAQHIELGPMVSNSEISNSYQLKSTSIDSSFIYYTDTINLPFFDNFTVNTQQEYVPDFSNPLTESELFYMLLDESTGLPIQNGVYFTNQVTFHRYVDLANDTYSDTIFTAVNAELADFSAYPVVYSPIDLYPPYYIYDTLGVSDISDTIWIESPPFYQDSARQFFMPVADSTKLWIDDHTYHNYRFGLNPRTLGVMTFDGLDANGYPYAIGTANTNYADYLTSKPINLEEYDVSDSLYISFLYQSEGLGDVPEPSDSLILEFYSSSQNQWFHIWSDSGTVVAPFRLVHIPIFGPELFF